MPNRSFSAISLLLVTSVIVISAHASIDNLPLDNHVNVAAEVKTWMDEATDDVFRVMTKAMGLSESRRSKRSPAILNSGFASDDTGFHRVTRVEALFPLCVHPVHVSLTFSGQQTYAVCVSATFKATLGLILADKWKPLISWDVEMPAKAIVFESNDALYVLSTETTRALGTELLRYDPSTNSLLVDHVVHSTYPTCHALWTMKADSNNYHLAIVNSRGPENDNMGEYATVFEWKGTYFDEYDSIRTYDPKDVTAFHIRGNAYLAVANHRAGLINYDVDSEIFKFDIDTRTWRSFQRIRTYGAVDFEYFEMGDGRGPREHFLAVANQFEIVSANGYRKYDVNSVIYKFVDHRFVPFQCLPTVGATGIATFTGQVGEFVLVVTNYFEAVTMYQYNGWNFVATSVQYSRGGMGPGALSASFQSIPADQNRYRLALIVANPIHEVEDNVFSISFAYENPVGQWYQDSLSWCRSAQRRFNGTLATELVDSLSDAYLIDQEEPIILDGDLHFEDSLAIVEEMGAPKIIDLTSGDTLDHTMLYELDKLYQQLQGLKDRLEQAKQLMSNSLRVSGDQTVTGELDFESASLSCEAGCDVGAVETTYLNEDDISNLYENVIYLDTKALLVGSLDMDSLHVEGDIVVDGLVSGVNASHLVTVDGHHEITAPKEMAYINTGEMVVDGLVNGIAIDYDHVLLSYGDQVVFGGVTVQEVEAQELVIEEIVNGVDLNELYQDIVYIGQKPKITGTKTIKGSVSVDELELNAGATLSGVDLRDLWENALWKREPQEIYPPFNFTSLHLVNPTVSTINGIFLNSPDLVQLSRDNEITSPVNFASPCTIDQANILDSINSIGLVPTDEYPNQLDLLLKSRDQVIFGQKILPSAHLSGSGVIGGLLNGVDLADLLNLVIGNNRTQTLPGDWVFGHVVFKGPVEVHGDIKGFELQELYNRALKLDQSLPSDASVVFTNLLQADQITGTINGVDVSKDLATKGANNVVSGIKHFDDVILLDHAVLRGLINGVWLTFLDETLHDGRDQRGVAHVTVKGDLVVQDLFVGGSLNGIPLDRVLTTVRDEDVFGPTHMVGDVVVENRMQTDSIAVNGLVNGQYVNDLVTDSLLYSEPQTVTGEKIFLNNLTVLAGANLETENVNGFNLRRLTEDTLFDHVPQMVNGKKTFAGKTHLDNLNFYGTIDGVSASEMMSNWVLQDLPQTIAGDVIVNGDVLVNSDVFSNLLNGVPLNDFLGDVVKLREVNEIRGSSHVAKAVLDSTVVLGGTLQGIDLSEEAVTRTGDRVIDGRKHFSNQLRINGDLNVDGLLDGVNVAELCAQTLTKHGDGHCPSLTVNGDVIADAGMRVGGLVGGVDLADFDRNVWKANEPVDMENPVHFNQLSLNGPVTLNGLLNGMDLTDLSENYLSLTKDQLISARYKFHDHITIDGALHCANLVTGDGLINELNLTSLINRVLRKIGDQNVIQDVEFMGDVHILGDLNIAGKLGGVTIPDDLMLKTRSNVLLSPITFLNHAVIINDLELPDGVTVQQVDVSEWAKNALFKHGHFSISGTKTFDRVTVVDARASRYIGGVNLTTTNVLTVEADQIIRRDVRFLKPVKAECETIVVGNVNGVNLNYFRESVVYNDKENVIRAPKHFVSDFVANNMVTAGVVDNVNLSVITDEMTYPFGLSDLERTLLERQSKLDRVGRIFRASPLVLNYYVVAQNLGELDVLAWASGSTLDGRRFLFVSDTGRHENGCSNVYVYVFSELADSYLQISAIPSSFAVGLLTFNLRGQFHLAIANVHPISDCLHLIGGLQIFKLNDENGLFEAASVLTDQRVVYLEKADFGRDFLCVIAVLDNSVDTYCSQPDTAGRFEMASSIALANVKTAKHSEYSGMHFLTLMDRNQVHLLVWDPRTYSFSHSRNVRGFKPHALSAITSMDEGQRINILVISEGTNDRSVESTRISVYEVGVNKLTKAQQMSSSPVLSMDWISYGNSFLLFVLTADSNVNVYNWKGSGGFVLVDSFYVKGSKTIHAIPCGSSENGCHYLSISGKVCAESWWENGQPFSLLLKAKVNGN